MYQIIFSINNNEEVVVLPAVPVDFGPELPQNNETYGGLSKDYNLLGTIGLWTFSLSSIFHVGKRYPFMPADASEDGWSYVEFFRKNRERRLPFRVIVLDSSGVCRLNSPCSIDSFSWQVKRNGDISYSMTVREYRFVRGGT